MSNLVEHFIEEKFPRVYRAHYAVWVYWWPLWRSLGSRRHIQRKWEQYDLIQEGQSLLDYGCGTGCFTIPAAEIVGVKGKVYALDCFSRQLEIVEKRAKKAALSNVITVLSENETGLPDECIDVVWMCDVLHEITQKEVVLEELHRVLKEGGTLAIYDGMRDEVLDYTQDMFSLTGRDDKLFRFVK